MNYKYSTINPITNKELYMYSSYHGIKFIKAYKQSRKQTIEKCLEKFKKIKGKKEITNRIYRLCSNIGIPIIILSIFLPSIIIQTTSYNPRFTIYLLPFCIIILLTVINNLNLNIFFNSMGKK